MVSSDIKENKKGVDEERGVKNCNKKKKKNETKKKME